MSTNTSEIKAALPEHFSGESDDAIRWIDAMEAYFSINPSTFKDDNTKSVTMLNKMNQGRGKYFAGVWLKKLADSKVQAADKDWKTIKKAFEDMFYPYHLEETARDELNDLRQTPTRKNDGFQTYLSKFQYLVEQSQAGDTPEVRRLFANRLDPQLSTMIYSMEKVPDTLKAWMGKAVDFHRQKARILALKKGHGLPLSSFTSGSSATKDPDAMDIDTIRLKKLSPADRARCIREGLCFRCRKKGHSANECRSTQAPRKPKGNLHSQIIRNAETTTPSSSTTPTIASATPIDLFIQNLTTKGKSPEDILQTLKICYEEDEENVAAATTFSDDEGF